MKKIHSILLLIMILFFTTSCACQQTNQIKSYKVQQAQPKPSPSAPPIATQQTKKIQRNSFKVPTFIVPNQIWIPSVSIKASVEPVGLLENGQLDVPESSEVAGLFIDGVLPGEKGNAIMAGHVDNYTRPAIFYPLKKLKPGDPVVLSNAAGQYLVFIVDAVESYPTEEAPLEKIFGDTDQTQLNLITCTGKFNRKKKEHEKRLIVYTHMMH